MSKTVTQSYSRLWLMVCYSPHTFAVCCVTTASLQAAALSLPHSISTTALAGRPLTQPPSRDPGQSEPAISDGRMMSVTRTARAPRASRRPASSPQGLPSETKTGGSPGGAVVENPPANAGDTGSSPGPGRSHMLRSN